MTKASLIKRDSGLRKTRRNRECEMDIKKLKTSELLNKVEDVGDNDVLFNGKVVTEI